MNKKGVVIKLFIPTTDYEAWQGLAKQSGVSVPVAVYSLASVTLREMLENERSKLTKKEVIDVPANVDTSTQLLSNPELHCDSVQHVEEKP